MSPSSGSRRIRQAFSLIELLVVISIIAVLAGMLLPTVSVVKDMSKQSRCASNMRQVVLASEAYRGENEGIYVQIYWDDPGWNTWSSWAYGYTANLDKGRWQHFLEVYTEDFSVFNCPVAAQLYPMGAVLNQPAAGFPRGATLGGWAITDMAYNGKVYGWTKHNFGAGPMTDVKLAAYFTQHPGTSRQQCPMFMDGVWQNDNAYCKVLGAMNGACWPHRQNRSNMAWPDGHIEAHSYNDVILWDPLQVRN